MFVTVTKLISTPGIFGFIMAALVAALMSTIDTLINASSVIFVNDIWRPYIKPNRADKHYLNVARTFSLLAAFIGVLLVPMFAGFKSLYEAHATFTAAITPPLVAAIVLGAFWKKYTTAGVCATLIGGTIAIGLSFIWPNEILPYFSLGVGPAGYGFMRAFYGLIVSVALGLIFNFLTKPKDMKEIQGYVCGTLRHAVENYKGAPLTKEANGKKGYGMIHLHEDQEKDTVRLPKKMMELLEAEPNDLVYVADKRRWLGGMYSAHLKALEAHDQDNGIWMHPETLAESTLLKHKEVYVEKIL